MRDAAIVPNLPRQEIREADINKRNIAIIGSVVAILVMSALGGLNGLDGLSADGTLLQRSVPVASVIYAVLGLAAGLGVLLRHRWSFFVAILWGVVVTYTGTVASVAWAEGDQPVFASAAMAFALCVVICGLVIWGVHIATRTP